MMQIHIAVVLQQHTLVYTFKMEVAAPRRL